MSLLIIAIAGVCFFLCAKYITNPASAPTLFSGLPEYAQTVTTSLLSSNISVVLDGSASSFSLSQVPSGSDYVGLLLSNTQTQIYLTYYEYLNWYQVTSAILTVPARSFSNGSITQNAWGGYSLTIDSSTQVITITSTKASTKSGITYRDASNAIKSITTSFLTLQPAMPTTATATTPPVTTSTTQVYASQSGSGSQQGSNEFVAKSSLDSISLYLINRRVINGFGYTYTYTDSNGIIFNVPLTFAILSLSGSPSGYTLTSADGQTTLYMTYAEGFNMMQNGSVIIPSRRSGGAMVGNSMSSGYLLSLLGNSVTITQYNQFVSLQTLISANVVDIYNQGSGYAFYPTYNLLGIGANLVNSLITNTQNGTYQYTSAGAGISVSAVDIVQINKRCGVQLSYTIGLINYVVSIPYVYAMNWFAANTAAQVAQQTANASLVLPAYVKGNASAADGTTVSILQPTVGSFTLQFDSSNPKKIVITFSILAPPAGYATITYTGSGGQVTVNAYSGT